LSHWSPETPGGTVPAMPTLARFYGIRVYIHWHDHPPPHVHIKSGEHKASMHIETLEIIHGRLPKRVRLLVLEWAMQHRGELRHAWAAVRATEKPPTIEPLD
jgi:hypothetical protein